MTFSKLCLLTKLTKLGLFNLKCMLKTNKDSNFSMDAFFFCISYNTAKIQIAVSKNYFFFFFGDNLCGGGMEILQKQKPPTPTHILSLLLENC